jgi:hypothetical protein
LLFTEFSESAPAAPEQPPEVMVVKKSKRREWTAQEVRELKSLARQKTPATQIARKLKRTEGATRQKALTLSVSLNSRPSKRKTPK